MWLTWIMLVVLLVGLTGPFLITATSPYNKIRVTNTPLHLMYDEVNLNLLDFRALVGIFLIILTSYAIGQEFHNGTIRILLSRGLGRLQLLLAKLVCIVAIALVLFVIGVIADSLLVLALLLALAGNLNALHTLTPVFWSDTGIHLLTVLISMGVTILMAIALNMLGRSLALGMTLALSWFAVDNVGAEFMLIAHRVTNSNFWLNITAYLLGPNVNDMPNVLIPANRGETPGINPLVPVSGAHTLWVTLVYAIIFVVVTVLVTRLRDVRE
jgi:ABC-type transport system involved in multi-copper enzyme maturation permease subunit